MSVYAIHMIEVQDIEEDMVLCTTHGEPLAVATDDARLSDSGEVRLTVMVLATEEYEDLVWTDRTKVRPCRFRLTVEELPPRP